MGRILIIDDDQYYSDAFALSVRRLGHQPICANTLTRGYQLATQNGFEVVFLDMHLPDGSGLEMLPRIKECASKPEVVIITGDGDPNAAELAIKSGAIDYIEKGASHHQTALSLNRILEYRREKTGNSSIKAPKLSGIVGSSAKMLSCYDSLAQAANSMANVLITGDTGTGKELFAKAIHRNSQRVKKPFVVVDCAALPENLVESVVFGHEKGAFTSAEKAHTGLIKQADGGTLFLDEVGELPLKVQASFLRVLQEHKFRTIGGGREISSDFRLVSATNRDLDAMVRAKKFREDLLFRLRAQVIRLPSLKEHSEDIRELVSHYNNHLCQRYRLEPKGLSPAFLDALLAYTWPGNVRELIACLEHAMVNAGQSPTLHPEHLPLNIRISLAKGSIELKRQKSKGMPLPFKTSFFGQDPAPSLKQTLAQETARVENSYLSQLMEHTGWDIKRACQIAGLGRSALYNRLKKYCIARKN
jgi:two-component system NtrC family response regulator